MVADVPVLGKAGEIAGPIRNACRKSCRLYFSILIAQTVGMAEGKDVRGAPNDPDLAKLYPSLSPAEFNEAKENLKRYVALALRVFERLESDPEAMARFEALLASGLDTCRNSKGPKPHSNVDS